MMLFDGPSLFDFAAARRVDPPTSIEAALSLDTMRVSRMMAIVLETIERRGGATIEEVADATGLSLVSVSPRFRPLERAGKIIATDKRRTNRSGRTAIVWEARPADGSPFSPSAGKTGAASATTPAAP